MQEVAYPNQAAVKKVERQIAYLSQREYSLPHLAEHATPLFEQCITPHQQQGRSYGSQQADKSHYIAGTGKTVENIF